MKGDRGDKWKSTRPDQSRKPNEGRQRKSEMNMGDNSSRASQRPSFFSVWNPRSSGMACQGFEALPPVPVEVLRAPAALRGGFNAVLAEEVPCCDCVWLNNLFSSTSPLEVSSSCSGFSRFGERNGQMECLWHVFYLWTLPLNQSVMHQVRRRLIPRGG